ncbi:MAG: GNAT family N-acetyltransferase [Acidobacteria bacterium]|nr:GNAT family N-acetyltransferase [Acidobacteriota bacterium]
MRFTIRRLHRLDEFKRCEELQKESWGFDDLDIVPAPMFVVGAKYGGIVLGGFESVNGRMVGFVYSLPAVLEGRSIQYSHMLAVEPEYRRHGIGLQLKIAQGRESVKLGYETIAWTFDPLQARNANLNLHRLGAVTHDYLVNVYGETSSPLHRGLQTDRVLARWRPGLKREERTLPSRLVVEGLPVLGSVARRPDLRRLLAFRVPIPTSIDHLKSSPSGDAAADQRRVRALFTRAFKAGFEAVDFELGERDGLGYYLFTRREIDG